MSSQRKRIVVGLGIWAAVVLFFFWPTAQVSTTTLSFQEPALNTTAADANILIVSGLFPLPKSKHSQKDYEAWLRKFLLHITTPIYFYTTPAFEPFVRALRPEGLPIVIDTTYASAFLVPPLKGREADYEKMHQHDREKFRHSPDLYAIWNAKPYLLDRAVKTLAKRGRTYDYAFWTDAGSFRSEHLYTHWPDAARVEQVWSIGEELSGGSSKKDLLFFPIELLPDMSMAKWTEEDGPIDNSISEGSFFGGSPSTVDWWAKTFYSYHDYYLDKGLFVGKDQTLINAILVLFAERIITVWHADPRHSTSKFFQTLGRCGDPWYYYEFWLSDTDTISKMQELWLQSAAWPWSSWQAWKDRNRCRVVPTQSFKSLLQWRFGKDWAQPTRTLKISSFKSDYEGS